MIIAYVLYFIRNCRIVIGKSGNMLNSFTFFTDLQNNNLLYPQPPKLTNEFNFVLDVEHFILMEFYVFDMFSSPEVIYILDILIRCYLCSEEVSQVGPYDLFIWLQCSWALPCFLTPRDISGSPCTCSSLDLKINCLPKELGSF